MLKPTKPTLYKYPTNLVKRKMVIADFGQLRRWTQPRKVIGRIHRERLSETLSKHRDGHPILGQRGAQNVEGPIPQEESSFHCHSYIHGTLVEWTFVTTEIKRELI